MKRMTMLAAFVIGLAAAPPALAVDTTQVYSSGPLIIAFIGLCALIILAQFAPAMFLVVGLIKSIAESVKERRLVRVRQKQ